MKSVEASDPAPAKDGSLWHAQVTSSKNESAARKSLNKIPHGHVEMLKGVPSGVTAAQIGGGTVYRAWLGRFDRSAEAVAPCSTLRAGGGACSVSKSTRGNGQKLASKL